MLPYNQQPSPPSSADHQRRHRRSTSPAVHHKGKTSVGSIAAIGAGLLVAVIALHGLWLRSEVRRADALEPLDPEAGEHRRARGLAGVPGGG